MITQSKYFISDFIAIQRNSFKNFLKKGLIQEFLLRNPITNSDFEIFFYPEYYQLQFPEFNTRHAILKGKTYSSKLYIPVQLTDKKTKQMILKWVFIGDIPIMTNRGFFIFNGTPRVIVNQLIRSPGLYYQEKKINLYANYKDEKPFATLKRYYADFICLRGTWLRFEIDKEKNIWAQFKKSKKLPLLLFLLAMGLNQATIFKSISFSHRLLMNYEKEESSSEKKSLKYVETPQQAWAEIADLLKLQKDPLLRSANLIQKTNTLTNTTTSKILNHISTNKDLKTKLESGKLNNSLQSIEEKIIVNLPYCPKQLISENINVFCLKKPILISNVSKDFKSLSYAEPVFNFKKISGKVLKKQFFKNIKTYNISKTNFLTKTDKYEHTTIFEKKSSLYNSIYLKKKYLKNKKIHFNKTTDFKLLPFEKKKFQKDINVDFSLQELGRKWIYNKFMNSRNYDLGKQGRDSFNRKLSLNISPLETTLTPYDVLYAADYLFKIEKGLKNIDDIDHLMNRKIRTSGELLQMQIGLCLIRLEKTIREELKTRIIDSGNNFLIDLENNYSEDFDVENLEIKKKSQFLSNLSVINTFPTKTDSNESSLFQERLFNQYSGNNKRIDLDRLFNNLLNIKIFNNTLKEFFGTNPLSQFMDQLNPLAEITHKRRLSSMGPGGIGRENAPLAIRSIHPTHYGRICPIETPEGKNTGLVNSLTTCARVTSNGFIETPFYRVYKGQVQKSLGIFFFTTEQEEKLKSAPADLTLSKVGFLPKSNIPVRLATEFMTIQRKEVQYIGFSPIQMISVATSLIPFLEHDDANRALMGSNMQRQAVPIIRPERPIVGTGLEARAATDSGYILQTKKSGFISYVSADKIIVYTKVEDLLNIGFSF